jgi:hypothetical protein
MTYLDAVENKEVRNKLTRALKIKAFKKNFFLV